MTSHAVLLPDPQSFSQLYARTHLIVFRYIYGLHGGPAQDVEDLSSETFLRAWKSRRSFHGDQDAALGWLLKIARNLVIDAHRREKARGSTQNAADMDAYIHISDHNTSPEEHAVTLEQFGILWKLLQNLPPEQREILVLRYMLGWQVKSIAAHLELVENTVSVKLRRILAQLRQDWPQNNLE